MTAAPPLDPSSRAIGGAGGGDDPAVDAVPRPGRARRGDVIDSLEARSRALDERAWSTPVREPAGLVDVGSLRLAQHALLRLTEVEVHGTDLDIGLPEWSGVLIGAALPFRLARLRQREVAYDVIGRDTASWLLVATDGPVHRVTVDVGSVTVEPADRRTPASASLEASSRDLLAVLLGRPCRGAVRIAGDVELGRRFPLVFPGP